LLIRSSNRNKGSSLQRSRIDLRNKSHNKKLLQMQPAVNTRVHGARSLLGRFGHYAPQPLEVVVAASLYRQKYDFGSGVGVIGGN
jgi:hypothetical protein